MWSVIWDCSQTDKFPGIRDGERKRERRQNFLNVSEYAIVGARAECILDVRAEIFALLDC